MPETILEHLLGYRLHRRLFLGVAHWLSVARLRRRAILTAFLVGFAATLVIGLSAKRLYYADVMIYVRDQCVKCHTTHNPDQKCPSFYDQPW
jgi:hypothetical protein